MRLILWNAALRSSVVACGREGNGRGDERQEIDEVWITRRCQSLSRLGFRGVGSASSTGAHRVLDLQPVGKEILAGARDNLELHDIVRRCR